MLEAALLAGAPLEGIYVAPDARDSLASAQVIERALADGVRVHELASGVMERVADAVSPQPILGVVGAIDVEVAELVTTGLLVVCVEVRDPGNVGAIIRSADAAGADGVICCAGSGDIYNPKTVRASAGSIFHVPIVVALGAHDTLVDLGTRGVRRFATVMSGGTDYAVADLSGGVAIVLGNEARGLDEETTDVVDEGLTIPIDGGAESLNVAMAATVLCFDYARRRRVGALGPTMTP